MSTHVPSRRAHPASASDSFPFRRAPLAGIVTALALLASASAGAADSRSVAELEAEIARLQQEIAAKARTGTGTPQAPAAEPAATEGAKALDTVVVRSRHRLERLKDVPISVAVVTGAELTREATADLEGVTKRISN
ncbi:MAG TPA: TonB-dependent receptor, partial [Zoogloea sp.]|nr:TonB-dependent receptor [Zoogloea sp.]